MKTLSLLWLLQLPSSAPLYREDSLVNAASQTVDRFAPNSILTLYGLNLSFLKPVGLFAEDVQLFLGTRSLEIFYVSPTQVNFRLPTDLRPSLQYLQLHRASLAGPRIPVRIQYAAPELFTTPDNWLLATRADGSLVTADKPVQPGETVVFYGTAFGAVVAPAAGQQPNINWLERASEFAVIVNGERTPGIYYVGTSPGFKGLYQVNYTFPRGVIKEPNPEIRVSAALGDRSRPGTRIWFKPE